MLRELSPLPSVTCHMSRATCHMSCVMCHMSCVIFFFLPGRNGCANRLRVCNQRVVPSLFNRPGVAGAVRQTPL